MAERLDKVMKMKDHSTKYESVATNAPKMYTNASILKLIGSVQEYLTERSTKYPLFMHNLSSLGKITFWLENLDKRLAS